MALGSKSRLLMELLAAFGSEVVEGVMAFPSLYKASSFQSEKSLREGLVRLEKKGWVARNQVNERGQWVAALTQAGIAALTHDIDPEALWNAEWDGKWRILSFDLPREESRKRQALRSWLGKMRFGCLQGSVWVYPVESGSWMSDLRKLKLNPNAIIYMEANFGGDNQNTDYAAQAWNFRRINEQYKAYLKLLSAIPPSSYTPAIFPHWFRRETEAWRAAFEIDPFLPRELWPHGYLGFEALAARRRAYRFWRPAMKL